MITAELTRKINLLSDESYEKVELFVEQLLSHSTQVKKEKAFKIFMGKMNVAEKAVAESGFFTEEDVEKELAKI